MKVAYYMQIFLRAFPFLSAIAGVFMTANCLLAQPMAKAGPDADGLLPEIQIAVVRDGHALFKHAFHKQVQDEIYTLAKDRYHVVLREDPEFSADWDPAQADDALRRALDAPDIDIILLQGLFVLQAATGQVDLTKPVTGAFLQDPGYAGVVVQDNRSQVPNLAFVMSEHSILDDIRAFADLVDFNRLHIGVAPAYARDMAALDELTAEIESIHECEVEVIPLTNDPETTLANLPYGAEAFYLFPPLLMEPGQLPELIEGINNRGVPSYAFWGEPAVHAGMLAAGIPDVTRQIARRTALNLQQIINGVSPNDLPVTFPVENRLFLNVLTARQIGYAINFQTTYQATLIGQSEAEKMGLPLTLGDAVDLALQKNFEFLGQQQATIQGFENKRLALSPMLPQVNALYSYQRIDLSQAQVGVNAGGQGTQNVGVQISQMIYSDERISNYRIQDQNYRATTLQEETVRLDTIQAASAAYIRFLAARTLMDIARDNLAVTRKNLNLARIRAEVGVAGPEEVYRFESQEASDQAAVANAGSQFETQRAALNQVLGKPLETDWQAEDLNLQSDYFEVTANRVVDLVSTDARYDRFRLFSLQYAASRSPEIQAVAATIRGQEISLRQKRRSFYLPEASASFQYNRVVGRDGVQNFATGIPGAITPDDDTWALLLQADLPIFEGGSRIFDVMRQKAVVRGLEYSEDFTRQLVQQRTLNALYALEASYSDIHFSAIAADRAQLNLNIVTEKYQAGSVSIVDLLDAQNEAFVQKQNYALANYSFLEDLVDYMRAMNWFEYMSTDQQNQDWLMQATHFIEMESTTLDAMPYPSMN